MSRREDFDNGFWGDPDIYPLTPHAKLVYIWTWTNSHCNLAGLYEVHSGLIATETGYTDNRVELALNELIHADLLAYDGRLMWVKGRIGRIGSRNPNVGKAIAKDLARAGDHPFLKELRSKYEPRRTPEDDWLRPAFESNGKPHG